MPRLLETFVYLMSHRELLELHLLHCLRTVRAQGRSVVDFKPKGTWLTFRYGFGLWSFTVIACYFFMPIPFWFFFVLYRIWLDKHCADASLGKYTNVKTAGGLLNAFCRLYLWHLRESGNTMSNLVGMFPFDKSIGCIFLLICSIPSPCAISIIAFGWQ